MRRHRKVKSIWREERRRGQSLKDWAFQYEGPEYDLVAYWAAVKSFALDLPF